MIVEYPDTYERQLVELMEDESLSLKEALFVDMISKDVNTHSILSIMDYMEEMFENLDKVQYYMQVYTGQLPDVGLVKKDK